MKTLLIALLCLSFYSSPTIGQETSTIKAFVRIHKNAHGIQVWSETKKDPIPTVAGNDTVKEMIAQLKNDTDALIEGHTTYLVSSDDNSHEFKPVFVIESIKPISLADLGLKAKFTEQPSLTFSSHPRFYTPPAIPVSTEISSAIIMTTSLLLMESLSAGNTTPEGKHEMRQALFLSAGTMATILFIHDQITGK